MRSGLWRNGDFLRLWAASSISELGSQVSLVALPLAAIGPLHASAFEVAVLATMEFAPFLLFGLPAGVWIDRLPLRALLAVADFARCLLLASVPLTYWLGWLTLTQLYVVGFAAGTFTIFFSVGYSALLPTIIEQRDYVEANAKLELTRSMGQTGGPAAGGALVSLTSAPTAVLADAVSFLVSGLLVLTVRVRTARDRSTRTSMRAELRDGIRFMRHNAYIRAAVVSAGFANFSFGVVWAVVMVFAVRTLHLGAATIGVVLALGGAGGILAALTAGRVADRIGVGRTMVAATALLGPGLLVIAVAPRHGGALFFALGWFVDGYAGTITAVIGPSVRTSIVPRELLGRVVATNRVVIWGIVPLGSLAGGALAASLGLRSALIVGALISLGALPPVVASPWRSLRDLPAATGAVFGEPRE